MYYLCDQKIVIQVLKQCMQMMKGHYVIEGKKLGKKHVKCMAYHSDQFQEAEFTLKHGK